MVSDGICEFDCLALFVIPAQAGGVVQGSTVYESKDEIHIFISSVVAPQEYFLILFSTILGNRQQVSFFCLSKRKVPKKKTLDVLLEFPIPIPCASKEKQALANSHGASRFIVLKQMLAMILFYFRCSAAYNEIDPISWYI